MSEFIWGLGRRKTAVARVRVKPGTGVMVVNNQDYRVYFDSEVSSSAAELALDMLGIRDKFDIYVSVNGGGKNAQAGAVLLGIARCLVKMNEGYEAKLRELGLLTRDPRMKERKKSGQKGARARYQFSKR